MILSNYCVVALQKIEVIIKSKQKGPILSVHFVHFAICKSFYLVSARCDSTFCMTKSGKSLENCKTLCIGLNALISFYSW